MAFMARTIMFGCQSRRIPQAMFIPSDLTHLKVLLLMMLSICCQGNEIRSRMLKLHLEWLQGLEGCLQAVTCRRGLHEI
jgi:hypothetical protein